MSIASLHLANTLSGEYNVHVHLPLPRPLHFDSDTGDLVRKAPEYEGLETVVGFSFAPTDTSNA